MFSVSRADFPNYDRVFSEKELIKLTELASALHSDSRQFKYPWYYKFMLMGFTLVFSGSAAFCGFIYLLSLPFNSLLNASLPSDIIWGSIELFPYSSLGIGMISGMFLTAWICILIARKNFTFLKYLSYQVGWGTLDGGEKSKQAILGELEDAYRKEFIGLDASPKNRTLIHKVLFERITPFWRKGTIVMVGLTFILFILDMRHFSYITKDNVVFSPYAKISVTNYSTKDIQEIERECYIYIPDGKLSASLRYYITFPNGEKIDLMNKEADLLKTDKYFQENLDIKRPEVRVEVFKKLKNVSGNLNNCSRNLDRKDDSQFQQLRQEVFGL